MSASEALNRPIAVTIAGKKYKARRISILALLSCAETYIIEQKLERIRKVAEILNDADRIAYIEKQSDKIPDGAALRAEAKKMFAKGDVPEEVMCNVLLEGLKQDQPNMTSADVADIFEESSEEEIKPLLAILSGKKKESRAKKTSGR